MNKTSQLSLTTWQWTLYSMAAAFMTYCSMYAFRKPFTAGVFADMQVWGIDYKILLIITQVLGYMLSKFIGIKVISEMTPQRRMQGILLFMGVAWSSLLLFAVTPYPYNFVWLFLNGLPLGMMWGMVFSYLEGRRNTELLGAAMCASFIVASGLVKSVAKYLMDSWRVSEFWMPFLTGLVFVLPLLAGVWMLQQIPPPSEKDQQLRTERIPMTGTARLHFFRMFWPGIILMVVIYIALTIFRDIRDNFAVEIWSQLGYADSASILLTAEIPIALVVFGLVAMMVFVQNNRTVFFANILFIIAGGLFLLISTSLFQYQMMSPAVWMISVGFAMYLPYISFHTMLFERWIALFRHPGNIGFLMYIADAFGYLGSVGILIIKNFGNAPSNWLDYLIRVGYITGLLAVALGGIGYFYFLRKDRSIKKLSAPEFEAKTK